jgi:hypothetical protein
LKAFHVTFKSFVPKLAILRVPAIYPMSEISDFQRTNSEFAKSEQKYPVKITLAYALIFPSGQRLSENVHYHQRDIFRKKLTKFDPWYPGGIKISDTTCGIPLNDVMRIAGQVEVTSSRRHGELGVWNSGINSCFSVVFVA